MPYSIRQAGKQYAIVKRLPGGRTQVVGHSATRRSAQASINARNAAAHGAKLGRR